MNIRHTLVQAGLAALFGSQALAANDDTLMIGHGLSVQLGHGPQDSALGGDSEAFYGLRYEPTVTWYWPDRQWPRWQGFVRTWLNYTSSQTNLPFQEQPRREVEHSHAELREFYLRRQLLGNDPRFSLTLGRQRHSDTYGLWWDDSLESLRLDYRATFASGFLAVAERFSYYNSDGSRLDETDRDIRYVLGEFAWRWHRNHWTGVRALHEHDHSGQGPDSARLDPQDFRGWRSGLFAHGSLPSETGAGDYRFEALYLQGNLETLAAAPTGGQPTVLRTRRTGWATVIELGQRFTQAAWSPRVSMRAGITDAPESAHDGFYFNRLQSGRVNLADRYASGLLGSFVRLDLNNVAFYSLALETQPRLRHHLDLRLSALSLRNPDAVDNRRNALPIAVSPASLGNEGPRDRDLGQVLDLTYHWQMFPVALGGRHLNLELQLNAGYFHAGRAFAALDDDYQLSLSAALHY